ncbi:hypothetical protein OG413_15640 [Streptomyces sp. NBC_01433]|uniref:hypothetical protein n=1 Tax=Streptomyces sp. NBC_01433 TaxID=2903864 RepID=UPI002258EF1B|nr:hypothetical protein [Streptomyces sp. NBC_01433]MCX4676717.1 hypothetical protein [Streptomyces sp. NBC_01433]
METWIRFWTALWIGSSRITYRTVDWLCNAKTTPLAPAPVKPKAEEPTGESDTDAGETEEQPADTGEQPKATVKPKKVPAKKAATSVAEGSALLRWVGLLITAAVAKGLPYTTTIAIGLTAAWVLTALVLGYAATMPPKDDEKKKEQPAKDDSKQPEEVRHPSGTMTRDHVALLLHTVYTEGSGVHLAALAGHLHKAAFMGHPRLRGRPATCAPCSPATRSVSAPAYGCPRWVAVRGSTKRTSLPFPNPLLKSLLLALLSQVRATTTTEATARPTPSRWSTTPPIRPAHASTSPATDGCPIRPARPGGEGSRTARPHRGEPHG